MVKIGDTSNSSEYWDESSSLQEGIKYYYRVKACNSDGCSDFSDQYDWGRVKTEVVETLSKPNLNSPSNGATITNVTPRLSWDSVSGATSYKLTLVDGNGKIIYNEGTFSSTNKTTSTLSKGTVYGWFVQACNSHGCGEVSNSYSFTIKDESSSTQSYDFYLRNESLNRTSANAGDTITASVKVYYSGNVRDSDMDSVRTGYYISSDSRLSSDDTHLEYDSSSLGSDDEYDSESESITIPSSLSTGTYYILFVADYNEKFSETNENNNVEYERIKITGEQNSKSCPLDNFSNNILSEYIHWGDKDTRIGGKKSQVKELQNFLNELGHNAGTADGDFGDNTYHAVERYQRANGLDVDGDVGSNTQIAINNTSCD